MYGPSAMDEQPWHFVIIDDKKTLDTIANFHPGAKMCKTAVAAILVCYDRNLEKYKNMAILDCAAATQNILLAAYEKGIGSVWVSILFRNDIVEGEIKKLFKLPEDIIPVSLIPLGYPLEKKQPPERFRKERIEPPHV